MRTLYNILFIIFFVLSAPFYFLKMWRRGNWAAGFLQRFGSYDAKLKQALTNRNVIWLHAVSVGEAGVCAHLVKALEQRLPRWKFVVSTTTSTGMGVLKQKLPQHVEKIYYPIDRRKYVRQALGTIGPQAMILVEAEIWPNFLWRVIDKEIPLFLVNARLSEKSFRGYSRFGFLFRPIFRRFVGVGAQNKEDAERLSRLGFPSNAVRVTGNLKFDAVKATNNSVDVAGMLKQLGVPEGAKIFVAGSTHAGEEKILADMYLRLKRKFPDLFFILVPRHFERTNEVLEQLQKANVSAVLRSDMRKLRQQEAGSVGCLLVNTTGELVHFYGAADIVFVGKSLTANGGQNPIEPAALGKAVVFGSNMQNFQEISDNLVATKGAVQVRDGSELESVMTDLLANPERCQQLGVNALKYVQSLQGGVDRTVELIVEKMREAEHRV